MLYMPADSKRYEPTWESLDTHPLPAWYDDVKFGIFIVWGVYAVPSYGNEWFWANWAWGDKAIVDFMKKNYPPGFTYQDFAAQFDAQLFNPNQWADILEASGAKYYVMTAKHHDGYGLWPSKHSFNWNSMEVGPKRDLIGEVANAVRKRTPDIHVGIYHSRFEWFNPLFNADKATGFKTKTFVENKAIPELYDLVNAYKPDIIWSDGDEYAPYTYWNSTEFIAWLYNDSPVKDTIVTNDRWGNGISCKHGDFYTCSDRFNPGVLMKHKWENCMTIDGASWGFRRNAAYYDYLSIESLIETLASTVSCGGNLLMDVGPTHDGRIVPILEERLRQMGQWLKINGQAIYSTKPWTHQNDTVTKNVWYTSKKTDDGEVDATVAYAIVLKWPKNDALFLGAPVTTSSTKVSMLGYHGSGVFQWTSGAGGKGININFPPISFPDLPSTWAWVLKLENLG